MASPADAANPRVRIDAIIAERDAEIAALRQQVAELEATVAAGETERKELHDLVIELQDNIAFNRTGRIP